MSFSAKRFTWLALTGLAILGAAAAPAHAQRGSRQPMVRGPVVPLYPVNPNGFTGAFPTAQQQLFNSRVIGRSIANIPPYAFGYNPYPSPIINTAPIVPSYPVVPTPGGGTPYATLSTSPYAAAASPYGGSLSAGDPYSLSTTGGYGGSGGYGYGGGYGGYPSYYNTSGTGPTLQGLASYNQSLGQYQIQIQQARIIREQSRQMQIETARKRLELEAYYERMKMTAPKLREIEQLTDLEWARKDPPAVEVWSGKSLNVLLKSIKGAGRNNLRNGPQIDLSDVSLESVNLTDAANRGNVGLLKQTDRDGKLVLNWPAAFERPKYAKQVEGLTRSMSEAVAALKDKRKPGSSTMKDVQKDFRTLSDSIAETGSTDELSPSQYIEAKRFLKQLDQAIKALNDPKASRYFDDWKPKGKTVRELVDHMMANGLEFAPATSGDEAAYSALYQALRAFESELVQSKSSSSESKTP